MIIGIQIRGPSISKSSASKVSNKYNYKSLSKFFSKLLVQISKISSPNPVKCSVVIQIRIPNSMFSSYIYIYFSLTTYLHAQIWLDNFLFSVFLKDKSANTSNVHVFRKLLEAAVQKSSAEKRSWKNSWNSQENFRCGVLL